MTESLLGCLLLLSAQCGSPRFGEFSASNTRAGRRKQPGFSGVKKTSPYSCDGELKLVGELLQGAGMAGVNEFDVTGCRQRLRPRPGGDRSSICGERRCRQGMPRALPAVHVP